MKPEQSTDTEARPDEPDQIIESNWIGSVGPYQDGSVLLRFDAKQYDMTKDDIETMAIRLDFGHVLSMCSSLMDMMSVYQSNAGLVFLDRPNAYNRTHVDRVTRKTT